MGVWDVMRNGMPTAPPSFYRRHQMHATTTQTSCDHEHGKCWASSIHAFAVAIHTVETSFAEAKAAAHEPDSFPGNFSDYSLQRVSTTPA
jgi:hypothetical protein